MLRIKKVEITSKKRQVTLHDTKKHRKKILFQQAIYQEEKVKFARVNLLQKRWHPDILVQIHKIYYATIVPRHI